MFTSPSTLFSRLLSQPLQQTRLCAALLATILAACTPDSSPPASPDSAATTGADQSATPYTRIYPPHPDDALAAHIYELDNGLRVYLTQNPEEPRFYAEIAVRAGSKQDPANATGLAHYLEHLLFKGNQSLGTLDYSAEQPHLEQIEALYEQHFSETDEQRRDEIYAEINRISQLAAMYAVPNEIDTLYSSMGASGLNAHTWHEETVYKVSLPANRLQQWAAIEADRFVDPVFRMFHTELEVVYEEKNRTLDNRDRISYYALADLLYKNHPYGQQSTIGDAEHLKNPSLVYIQDYFDTWYVPNNMAIFISGDIDIEETMQVISDEFSDWEARPLPPAQSWQEAPITDIERVTVTYPGQEEVQMAFRTVPVAHPDQEALMLLDMILDNRTAGLINLNLNQRQRVQAAGSSPEFLNDYGSQRLWGVPREGQSLEEVEALLLEQLDIIKRGEFDDWILPAILNDFRRMNMRALESNTARVADMRSAFLSNSDWNYHINQMARLEAVTRQDIVDVANRYFGDNNYVAVHRVDGPAVIPPVDKPQIDPVQIDPSRQSQFAARILAMPYEEIEPTFLEADRDYQITGYAPDVPLYYARNPLNELFTLSISIDIGTEENDLLSLAGALMGKAGTENLSAEELQKEWYRLGSDFGLSSSANETSIVITGLDSQFEESLALMLELISAPRADEETFADLKATILQARREQREDPQAISQALYLYNRYGDESPMLQAMSSDAIAAVELDDLVALISGLQQYQHRISYTGSMPLERVTAILRDHHQPADLLAPPAYQYRRARQITDNEIYVIHRETAQSQVRLEFPDGTYQEDLVVPASVYNSYFGASMSSVVFQELREARALAYSAGANYAQGSRLDAQTMVLGAIGSQNDKAVEATAVFVDLFDNMPRSSDRFEDAVNSLLNRYRTSTVGFRQIPGTVYAWQQLGLNGDPRRQRFAQLQEMTLEQLLQFQQTHVAGRAKLISIVGDTSRIDMDALAELGTIRELTVADVFVE
ncbi:MAG: insulinase family protein [Pseudohongiella sp.]|uniref:M16 family metallopeptidase n=1 Tax=Pseudohongiella sp. TaxID=1979412 RepID=UPI0034A0A082